MDNKIARPIHLLTVLLFPQDDFRVCTEYNIIQRDQTPICPVDASGCFTSEVTDFAGQHVKVSDTSYIYMQIRFADISAILLLLKSTGMTLGINAPTILIAGFIFSPWYPLPDCHLLLEMNLTKLIFHSLLHFVQGCEMGPFLSSI